ncbi:DUF2513 domain-containing protein [Clostridium felsineum]|uniref:DUF2513 domain-containing protein n=1 Tax=Clostridium felsineum TaxID=36839 RepID=UPI00214DCC36|nr:DUF2513 domain-containing protein [Clostridium felsineum]MCR3761796.1 DUF2513 domain-containing protein [Clostridium felsineum]
MERDMELVRKILLYIEKNYVDVALYDLNIEGYDLKTIAYHCKLCYEEGMISDYKDYYAGSELRDFGVSSLTWKGHDFLEKIRNDNVWSKIKSIIKQKKLSSTIPVVEKIATKILDLTVQSVINNIN